MPAVQSFPCKNRLLRAPFVLVGLLVCLVATGPASAVEEVRAIWVTRWDYARQGDIPVLIENCARLGLNRIYFQVRGQADAYYRSKLEPWAEELEGDPKKDGDPGFDPLADALHHARKHDIELFAWVNVLPAWKGRELPRSKAHIAHKHPEWFLTEASGRRILARSDRYTLLNPCLPEVRAHLAIVLGDIATRYAVDGIQLDYIRFLSRRVQDGEDVPFDSRTLADFRKLTRSDPGDSPAAWDRYRIRAMDDLVKGLADSMRRARPKIRVSVAAIKDIDRARQHFFQDVPRWIRSSWVDEVCPMIYTRDDDTFEDWIRTWKRHVSDSKIVAGLGAYLLKSGRQVHGQIHISRLQGLDGYSIFSYPSCFLSRSHHSLRDNASAELRQQMRNAVSKSNSAGS